MVLKFGPRSLLVCYFVPVFLIVSNDIYAHAFPSHFLCCCNEAHEVPCSHSMGCIAYFCCFHGNLQVQQGWPEVCNTCCEACQAPALFIVAVGLDIPLCTFFLQNTTMQFQVCVQIAEGLSLLMKWCNEVNTTLFSTYCVHIIHNCCIQKLGWFRR